MKVNNSNYDITYEKKEPPVQDLLVIPDKIIK